MAYDPHTYVTLYGTLSEVSGQDEIWQIGIRGFDTHGGGRVPLSDAHMEDYADQLVSATSGNIGGWFSDANAHMSSSAHLRHVKVAHIGADGKYVGGPVIRALDAVGANTGQVPSFCSVAFSWTSARTYGRTLRYGRVYPPNYASAIVAGTATITSSAQADALATAQGLYDAVQRTEPDWQFDPHLVSKSGGSALITGVRVGNVYDVQRRRKNAVRETYVSHVVP